MLRMAIKTRDQKNQTKVAMKAAAALIDYQALSGVQARVDSPAPLGTYYNRIDSILSIWL